MLKKASVGGSGVTVAMFLAGKVNQPEQFYWDEFLKLNDEERGEILAGVHDSQLREKLPVNYDIWFYDMRAQQLLFLWADSDFDLVATRLKWQ
jgi:hypothetical protein